MKSKSLETLDAVVRRKDMICDDKIPVNERNLKRVAPFGARNADNQNVTVLSFKGDFWGKWYQFFKNQNK